MVIIPTQFLMDHKAELWSLGTVIFGAIVTRVFRLKPKLNYSIHNASNLLVEEPLIGVDGKQISPRQLVRIASIAIENAGLQPAKAVELAFNWKPPIMNVTPARAYSEAESPHDRYSIIFDSLAPGERATIEIMAINAELPMLTAVRSEGAVGKLISMAPQRVWPSWLLNGMTAILLLGMATLIYLFVTLIQIIAR